MVIVFSMFTLSVLLLVVICFYFGIEGNKFEVEHLDPNNLTHPFNEYNNNKHNLDCTNIDP